MTSARPTLAETGHTLRGPNWAEPMAEMLDLTKEEVIALAAHPDKIAPHLYDQLIVLCRVRMQEIAAMLGKLEALALVQGDSGSSGKR